MKLRIGTSSVLLTETEEKFKLVLDLDKLKGTSKAIALVIAFSAIAVLACAGFIWLALGIFCTLVVLLVVDFLRNGIDYPMDFELGPDLAEEILHDVLVEGR